MIYRLDGLSNEFSTLADLLVWVDHVVPPRARKLREFPGHATGVERGATEEDFDVEHWVEFTIYARLGRVWVEMDPEGWAIVLRDIARPFPPDDVEPDAGLTRRSVYDRLRNPEIRLPDDSEDEGGAS